MPFSFLILCAFYRYFNYDYKGTYFKHLVIIYFKPMRTKVPSHLRALFVYFLECFFLKKHFIPNRWNIFSSFSEDISDGSLKFFFFFSLHSFCFLPLAFIYFLFCLFHISCFSQVPDNFCSYLWVGAKNGLEALIKWVILIEFKFHLKSSGSFICWRNSPF